MADIREDILARLLEVVATVPNLLFTQRNNPELNEDQLPCAIVFDGDEEAIETTNKSSRLPGPPILVNMMPQIEIAQQADNVGSDLSVLRRELIKRVLFDSALIAKTGNNGTIHYLGCQTDPTWMRTLYGAMRVQFRFKYPLKPDEL